MAVLNVLVDDYAEVWINGQMPRRSGYPSPATIQGLNMPNRVVLGTEVKAADKFQSAAAHTQVFAFDPLPLGIIKVGRHGARLDLIAGLLRRLGNRPLPEWAGEMGCTSWAQILLKFVLAHPSVTCVIPGTGNPAHMADNCRAGSGMLPDVALRKRIIADWEASN